MATNREIVFILKMRNQARNAVRQFSNSFRTVGGSAQRANTFIRRVVASARAAAASLGVTSAAANSLGTSAGPAILQARLLALGATAQAIAARIGLIGSASAALGASFSAGIIGGTRSAGDAFKQFSVTSGKGVASLTSFIGGSAAALDTLRSSALRTSGVIKGTFAAAGNIGSGANVVVDINRQISGVQTAARGAETGFRRINETASQLGKTTAATTVQTVAMGNAARTASRTFNTGFSSLSGGAQRANTSIGRVIGSTQATAAGLVSAARAATSLGSSPGPGILQSRLAAVGATAQAVAARIATVGTSVAGAGASLVTGFAAGARDAVRELDNIGRGRGLRNVTAQAGTATTAMTGLQNVTRRTAGLLGASLFGGVALVSGVRTIADFERQMSAVRAITGATDDQFVRLNNTAKKLGATTEFTATQAASGLEFLARTGFTVQQSIQALPATLDLATAGAIGLGRSADIASNILSTFGIAAERTSGVADVLALVTAKTNTNILNLGEAMKFAGPAARSLGVSLNETASAVGILGDLGIQGTLAGTSIRAILNDLKLLSSGLAPKRAQDAFKGFGIDPDLIDPEKVGLTAAIKELKEAGVTQAALLTLFGERGAGPIRALIDNYEKLTTTLKGTQNAFGETARQASIVRDNLRGDFDTLVSSIQAAFIRLGEAGGTNVLRTIVQFATGVVRSLAGIPPALGELDQAVKNTADAIKILGIAIAGFIGFKVLTSGVGILLSVVLSVRPAVVILVRSLGFLSIALGSITSAAKLIAPVLAAAFVGGAKGIGTIIAALTAATAASLKFVASLTVGAFRGFSLAALAAVGSIRRFTAALVIASIVKYRLAVDSLSLSLVRLRNVSVAGIFGGLAAGARRAGTALRAVAGAGIVGSLGIISTAFKAIGVALLAVGAAALASPVGIVLTAIAAAVLGTVGAFIVLKNRVTEVSGTFATLGDRVRAAINVVSDTIQPAIASVQAFVQEVLGVELGWEAFKRSASSALDAVANGLAELPGITAGVVASMVEVFRNFPAILAAVFRRAVDGAKRIWNGFIEFFIGSFNRLANLLGRGGLSGDGLKFEISETPAIDALDRVIEKFVETRRRVNEEAAKITFNRTLQQNIENTERSTRDFLKKLSSDVGSTDFTPKISDVSKSLTSDQLKKIDDFNESFRDRLRLLQNEVDLQNVVGRERDKANALAEVAIEAQKAGIKDILPLLEEYGAAWDRVQELQEGSVGAIRGVKTAVQGFIDDATNTFENFSDITRRSIDGLADRFSDFLTGGEVGFKEFVDGLIKDLTRFSVRFVFAKLFESGGFGSAQATAGGVLGSLFGGAGPVGGAGANIGTSVNPAHVIITNAGVIGTAVAGAGGLNTVTRTAVTGSDGVGSVTSADGFADFDTGVRRATEAVIDLSDAANAGGGAEILTAPIDQIATAGKTIASNVGVLATQLERATTDVAIGLSDQTRAAVGTIQPLTESPEFKAAQEGFGSSFRDAVSSFTGRAAEVFERGRQNIVNAFSGGVLGGDAARDINERSVRIIDMVLPSPANKLPEIEERARKIQDRILPEVPSQISEIATRTRKIHDRILPENISSAVAQVEAKRKIIYDRILPENLPSPVPEIQGKARQIYDNMFPELPPAVPEIQSRAQKIYNQVLPVDSIPDTSGALVERVRKFQDRLVPETLPGGLPSIGEGQLPQIASGLDQAGFNAAMRQVSESAQRAVQPAAQIPIATRQIATDAREAAIASQGIPQNVADHINNQNAAALQYDQMPAAAQRAATSVQSTATAAQPAPAAAQEFTRNVQQAAQNAKAAAANTASFPGFVGDIGDRVQTQGNAAAGRFGSGLQSGLGISGGGGILGVLGGIASQLGGKLGGIVSSIIGIFSQLLNSLGSVGGIGGGGGLFGGLLGGLFHDGGIVGAGDNPMRWMSRQAVRSAKRFHSGLGIKGDEFPAILQRGEIVISRDQVRQLEQNSLRRSNTLTRGGSTFDAVRAARMLDGSSQQAVLAGQAPAGLRRTGGATNNITVQQTIVAPNPQQFRATIGQQATQTKAAMDKQFSRNN